MKRDVFRGLVAGFALLAVAAFLAAYLFVPRYQLIEGALPRQFARLDMRTGEIVVCEVRPDASGNALMVGCYKKPN